MKAINRAGAGEDSRALAPQDAIPHYGGSEGHYYCLKEFVAESPAFQMLTGAERWILQEAIRTNDISASGGREWFAFPAGAGLAPLDPKTHHAAMEKIVSIGFFDRYRPHGNAAWQYRQSCAWKAVSLDEKAARKAASRAKRLARDKARKHPSRNPSGKISITDKASSLGKISITKPGISLGKISITPLGKIGVEKESMHRMDTYLIPSKQPHPTIPMTQAEARALAVETIEAYEDMPLDEIVALVERFIEGMSIEEARARLNAALSEAVPVDHPEAEHRGLYALLLSPANPIPAPEAVRADSQTGQTVEETAPSAEEYASAPFPETEPDPDDPALDREEYDEDIPQGTFSDLDSQYEQEPDTTSDNAPKRSPEPIQSLNGDSDSPQTVSNQSRPPLRQPPTASKLAPHVATSFIPSKGYMNQMRGA